MIIIWPWWEKVENTALYRLNLSFHSNLEVQSYFLLFALRDTMFKQQTFHVSTFLCECPTSLLKVASLSPVCLYQRLLFYFITSFLCSITVEHISCISTPPPLPTVEYFHHCCSLFLIQSLHLPKYHASYWKSVHMFVFITNCFSSHK